MADRGGRHGESPSGDHRPRAARWRPDRSHRMRRAVNEATRPFWATGRRCLTPSPTGALWRPVSTVRQRRYPAGSARWPRSPSGPSYRFRLATQLAVVLPSSSVGELLDVVLHRAPSPSMGWPLPFANQPSRAGSLRRCGIGNCLHSNPIGGRSPPTPLRSLDRSSRGSKQLPKDPG